MGIKTIGVVIGYVPFSPEKHLPKFDPNNVLMESPIKLTMNEWLETCKFMCEQSEE